MMWMAPPSPARLPAEHRQNSKYYDCFGKDLGHPTCGLPVAPPRLGTLHFAHSLNFPRTCWQKVMEEISIPFA